MGFARAIVALFAIVFLTSHSNAAGQQTASQKMDGLQIEGPAATAHIRPDTGIADGILNGHYAFAFSGYQNGSPLIMTGAFVADGHGNLTAGVLDVNDGTGEPVVNHNVIPQMLTAGSVYSLTASRLGTMTLVTSASTYQFKIVVSPNACTPNPQFLSTCGRLIMSDPANPQNYGSGVIKVQDPQYFDIRTFFPGNFTVQIVGTDPSGKRYAGAGAFGTNTTTLLDLDCSSFPGGTGWDLDGCPVDENDDGRVAYNPVKGSFAAYIDPVTGRGNFANFSFPSDPNGYCARVIGTVGCNYAFYVVDKQQMILMAADPVTHPANLVLWFAVRQSPPPGDWTLGSLSGTTVAEMSALDPNGGAPAADVSAGLFRGDGNGNATLTTDENDGGLLTQPSSTGTYALDSSGQKTGRVTMQGFGAQFGAAAPVLYLSAANTGFLVGRDAKVTSGLLEAQVGAPFNNGSLINTYAGGSIAPVLPTVTNTALALSANGAGNASATQYTSGPNGPRGPRLWLLTYQADATGRVVVQQGLSEFGIAYIVSATKAVMVPTGTAPALNVFASAPSN
jgi:hypothetical protein